MLIHIFEYLWRYSIQKDKANIYRNIKILIKIYFIKFYNLLINAYAIEFCIKQSETETESDSFISITHLFSSHSI